MVLVRLGLVLGIELLYFITLTPILSLILTPILTLILTPILTLILTPILTLILTPILTLTLIIVVAVEHTDGTASATRLENGKDEG
jgi:hypothetical protein